MSAEKFHEVRKRMREARFAAGTSTDAETRLAAAGMETRLLAEMAALWDGMSDEDRAAVSIGGKYI